VAEEGNRTEQQLGNAQLSVSEYAGKTGSLARMVVGLLGEPLEAASVRLYWDGI
jgi:hypothetical protein